MPSKWTEHIKATRKEGESYKDAMKRASSTYKKPEKIVKEKVVKAKPTKVLKKDLKEKRKKPDQPRKRKKKVVEEVEEAVED